MNLIHDTAPARLAPFEAVSVSDDDLARIEGGFININSLPLIVVKILDMIRTPPTVPRT